MRIAIHFWTLLAVAAAGFGNSPLPGTTKSNKPIIEAVSVKKEAVELYPNPSTNGRITVSSNLTETLHFYVFDLEGTLMHQVVLKAKEKRTIENLKKGIYVYDAFLNDKGVVHGNIIVK